MALTAGYVAFTKVVGAGFTWLAAGTALLVSLAGAFADGALVARLGMLAMIAAAVLALRRSAAGVLLLIGGFALLIEASRLGGWLPAVSATLGLGGVTGEMLLGHWYLVDPRLPRWTLRALAVTGIVGLVFDGAVLAVVGGFPEAAPTVVFWLLLATSIGLMLAVIAALRYPAYSGVMAATGLSYLAVLTTLGAVFLGRALVAGIGPFAI